MKSTTRTSIWEYIFIYAAQSIDRGGHRLMTFVENGIINIKQIKDNKRVDGVHRPKPKQNQMQTEIVKLQPDSVGQRERERRSNEKKKSIVSIIVKTG